MAISGNMRGWQGEILRRLIEPDIEEEFGHARKLAARIKTLGFSIPHSSQFRQSVISDFQIEMGTSSIQSVQHAAEAIIKCETEIIGIYETIIEGSCDSDPVTADLATTLLSEEQEHLRVMQDLVGQQ